MPNPQNLKNFTKNDPRRINKPKGAVSISTRIKHYLAAVSVGKDLNGNPTKLSAADQIALASIKKAIEGDSRHTEIVLERMEGKITQPIDQNTKFDLSGLSSEKLEALLDRLKDA